MQDLGRAARAGGDLHRGRDAGAHRGGAKRGGEAELEQRHVDPLREARRLVEGVLHVAADLLEERLCGGGIGVERGLRELEPHGERHQVLLHAAVQLALDPAAVGIGGADEPCPRRAQLGELRA